LWLMKAGRGMEDGCFCQKPESRLTSRCTISHHSSGLAHEATLCSCSLQSFQLCLNSYLWIGLCISCAIYGHPKLIKCLRYVCLFLTYTLVSCLQVYHRPVTSISPYPMVTTTNSVIMLAGTPRLMKCLTWRYRCPV